MYACIQLYHSEAEECMYELVDFAHETELPVTGIRFIQGEGSKQYLLIAACKYIYINVSTADTLLLDVAISWFLYVIGF